MFDVRTIEQEIDGYDEKRTHVRSAHVNVRRARAAAVRSRTGYLDGGYGGHKDEKNLASASRSAHMPHRVVRLVLREAVLLVAIELAVGVSLASALAGTLEGVLFGVQPDDWRSVADRSPSCC